MKWKNILRRPLKRSPTLPKAKPETLSVLAALKVPMPGLLYIVLGSIAIVLAGLMVAIVWCRRASLGEERDEGGEGLDEPLLADEITSRSQHHHHGHNGSQQDRPVYHEDVTIAANVATPSPSPSSAHAVSDISPSSSRARESSGSTGDDLEASKERNQEEAPSATTTTTPVNTTTTADDAVIGQDDAKATRQQEDETGAVTALPPSPVPQQGSPMTEEALENVSTTGTQGEEESFASDVDSSAVVEVGEAAIAELRESSYAESSSSQDASVEITPTDDDVDDEEGEERVKDFTIVELNAFDGGIPPRSRKPRPIYIALRGNVYDASAGRSIYGPDGEYSELAGHDISRRVARGLKVESSQTDGGSDLDDLSLDGLDRFEKMTLAGWEDIFKARGYPVLGRVVAPPPP